MTRYTITRTYTTWLGCNVREEWVALANGGFGLHVELST
jgi:hypothetical protein